MNFIHASICPFLWGWYDDDVACFMFIFLQNCLNLSEQKLPPASDIIFFSKPYSKKIILNSSIKLSADRSSVFIYNPKIFCNNLQLLFKVNMSFSMVWSVLLLELLHTSLK